MAQATKAPVTFFIDGHSSYGLKIVDTAVAARLPEDIVWFTQVAGELKCAFTTDEAAVVKHLRGLKASLGVALREDLRSLQLRCPQCDFVTDGNTEADHIALADHIASHDLDAQEPVTSKPKLEERVPQVEDHAEVTSAKANVKSGKITAGS